MTNYSFPIDPNQLAKELKKGDIVQTSFITSIVEKRQVEHVVQGAWIVIGPPIRECSQREQFFLYGSGITGNDGHAQIPLTSYLCHPNLSDDPHATRFAAQDMPWFIATPVSRTACYLTHSVDIVPVTVNLPPGAVWVPWPAADIVVHVYTWLPDGTPASLVQFSWHCSANCTKYFNP